MNDKKRPQDITSEEKNHRVNEVYKLLLSRRTRNEIIQFCSENFDVSERTTDIYLHEARKKIDEISKVEQSEIYTIAINNLFELLNRAHSDEDNREARNIIKDLRDLFGLDKNKVIDSNINVSNFNIKDLVRFKD